MCDMHLGALTWMTMGRSRPSGWSLSMTRGAVTYCCFKMITLGLTPSSMEKSASNRDPAWRGGAGIDKGVGVTSGLALFPLGA